MMQMRLSEETAKRRLVSTSACSLTKYLRLLRIEHFLKNLKASKIAKFREALRTLLAS